MNARAKIAAASNGKKPTKRTAGRVTQRELQVHAIRQQLKGIIDMAIGVLAMVDLLADASPNDLPTNAQLRPPTLMGNRRSA